MKPAPFTYRRPDTLDEALQLLAGDPTAKVLAGGQSLVPLLSMRLAAPTMLVDITGLPGLDGIDTDADGVRVGALAPHAAVLADQKARDIQPLLAQALSRVAHGTIRNRGTTVGSLVHADAAAEMPAVLALLAGEVLAASPRGRRTIPAQQLFVGPMETTLAHDEIALQAWFPALPAGGGVAFDEVARRHGDYALCGVAARVLLAEGRISQARASYLSVSEVPTVVDVTEPLAAADSAEEPEERSLSQAAETALAQLDPLDDIHASAAYRARLVRVLTARVLRAAVADARQRADNAGGEGR